jgi:phage terminase large subunit-like protein
MPLTLDERLQYDRLIAEAVRRSTSRFSTFFADSGPLARTGYLKHLDFFAAGKKFKERLFMAANRVGKSEAGAYELTCHLTGLYPAWWEGRRFETPVECWAVGTNSQTTRDIVQAKLLGSVQMPGTGMVPSHLIVSTISSRGLPGALEGAVIRHASGGTSLLGLKTYEQGRQSFEGTSKDVIWCDEEPPASCYTEMLYRTVTTKGIVMVTFTPLQGMSDVVKGFLEPETDIAADFKTFIQAGWKDVPHLDAEEQRALMATTPPYQLAARTEGEPSLGSGAIYPIAEREILVPTAEIPDNWPRVYAMDVGWNRTAVVWGAKDPGSGRIVLYDEHYMGHGEPASHAAGIRARGDWIRGVIDPASSGSSQIDGRKLIDIYGRLGLRLEPAINAVEAGLTETWNLLVSGRLVVQEHLSNWRSEFRKYHRDEQGKIVKVSDHLMDATRYLVISGRDHMHTIPRTPRTSPYIRPSDTGWMSA